MSTRKIKDAKDLSTNELIYFKGHAQATYMSDGRTVEDAINNVTDFKTINGESILGNGDITIVEPRILEFTGEQLTADQLNRNIETYNKILNHEKVIVYEPALEGRPMYPLYIKSFDNSIITLVRDLNDLSYTFYKLNSTGDVQFGIITEQLTFPDSFLSTTSTNTVQNKVVTEELARKGTYSKPSGGIPKSDMSVEVQGMLDKVYITDFDRAQLDEVISGGSVQADITALEQAIRNNKIILVPEDREGIIDGFSLLVGYVDDFIYCTIYSGDGAIFCIESYYDGNNELGGSVAELKYTIRKSELEHLRNSYIKPSSGIPKSDLDSSVQTLLNKADTALQSYTEQYKGTVTGVKINGSTKNPSSGVVDLGTVITSHQDISGKADISSLATVATSGSYNDLSNKPTIPSAVTETTVSGWGFTKNTGTVTGVKINNSTKSPSNGVVDLGTVITSHQSIKTINNNTITGSGNVSVGTITQVQANGTNVSTSGVANIPAASTSAYGVTKLSSATNSTSTSLAATASAVKAAYDLANSYKGTVTGVKVNGTTKSPTSGTVDVGNVVTSIKVNGTTKSPTSGVVDLGTISGGGSSEPYVLDVTSLASSAGAEFGVMGEISFEITLASETITEIENALNEHNLAIKTVTALYRNISYIYTGAFVLPNNAFAFGANGSYNGNPFVESVSIMIDRDTSVCYIWVQVLPPYGKFIREASGGSMMVYENEYTINTNKYLTSLTVTFQGGFTPRFLSEYFFEFTINTSGTTVSLPSDIKWVNEEVPTFRNGYTYQVSVVNGFGIIAEFKA